MTPFSEIWGVRPALGSPQVGLFAKFCSGGSVFDRNFSKRKTPRGVCFRIAFREKDGKGNLYDSARVSCRVAVLWGRESASLLFCSLRRSVSIEPSRLGPSPDCYAQATTKPSRESSPAAVARAHVGHLIKGSGAALSPNGLRVELVLT